MKILTIKKLRIRNRSLQQLMTGYIAVLPLLLAILTEFLGVPSFVKYTIDIAWCGLLALVFRKSRVLIEKKVFPMLCVALSLFLYTLITYSFHFQSPMYYLWGVRNNFRFYVAFFAFVAYLDEGDAESLFGYLDVLFWINVVVSFVQFFFMGYRWDYLGGIFGTELGCNASTLLFFSVVLSRSVLQMMTGEKKNISCIMQLVFSSIIAALAELKVYFLMLAVILMIAAVLTKFSWKKCLILLVLVFCLSLGSNILVSVFGSSSMLSLENILRLIFADNYSSESDLSRLNAISVLSRTILREPLDQWIGLGLGNCDTSAFSIFNTPFYQNHSQLHYNWFSTAFLFLETGYLGLTLYVSFFVVCMIFAFVQMRKQNGNQLYCRISIVTAIVCVILTIYNASLRSDVGYLAYFALAVAFVKKRCK